MMYPARDLLHTHKFEVVAWIHYSSMGLLTSSSIGIQILIRITGDLHLECGDSQDMHSESPRLQVQNKHRIA